MSLRTENLVFDGEHSIGPEGTQRIYRFANGYGASIVRHPDFTFGALELAVVRFRGPESKNFEITYDTPISADVERGDVDDMNAMLEAISELPAVAS